MLVCLYHRLYRKMDDIRSGAEVSQSSPVDYTDVCSSVLCTFVKRAKSIFIYAYCTHSVSNTWLSQIIPRKGQTDDRPQLRRDFNTFSFTVICMPVLGLLYIFHYHQHLYNQINNVALKARSPLKDLNPLLNILTDSTNFVAALCQNVFATPVMLSFPSP